MKTVFTSCILLSVIMLACSPKVSKKPKSDIYYDAPAPSNSGSGTPAVYVYLNDKWIEATLENALKYNGNESFWNVVVRNMKYPAEARENGIEGTVMSQVTVNELGVVELVKVVKGVSQSCDQAALNAINQAITPGFEPATLNGKPVKYKFFVPLKFYLTR